MFRRYEKATPPSFDYSLEQFIIPKIILVQGEIKWVATIAGKHLFLLHSLPPSINLHATELRTESKHSACSLFNKRRRRGIGEAKYTHPTPSHRLIHSTGDDEDEAATPCSCTFYYCYQSCSFQVHRGVQSSVLRPPAIQAATQPGE